MVTASVLYGCGTAVATYYYYENVRRTMLTAVVSYLLNYKIYDTFFTIWYVYV